MRSSSKKGKPKGKKPRDKLLLDVRAAVLAESGYKCGNPTCRNVLSLEVHHIVHVEEGGKDDASNLLPLCGHCHGFYHNRQISRQSIFVWKSVLVSLSRAYDVPTLDQLLFLNKSEVQALRISGDGVLPFARLIGGDLATFKLEMENGILRQYSVGLTQKGKQLVSAWQSGDPDAVNKVLGTGLGSQGA